MKLSDSDCSIVLHKIYNNDSEYRNFEDVSFNIFQALLYEIKEKVNHNVLITFDDGNISDYLIAFPELSKNSMRAIFFIIPSLIGSDKFLNWNMVKEMSKNGMVIGSHSLTHKNLTELSEAELDRELRVSKEIIEDKIGNQVNNFSCPYGIYNRSVLDKAQSLNYKSFFTSDHGIFKNNSFKRPRNSINALTQKKQLPFIVKPTYSKIFMWRIEDILKLATKRAIGQNMYLKIRNIYSENSNTINK